VIAHINSPCCTDSTTSNYFYQNTATGMDLCVCPRCGCIHPQGQWASDTIILPAPPHPRDRPFLTPEQIWRLKNLSYRLSRDAIVEARMVQKGARDDLRAHVSLQARHRPYVRPPFKSRVCGGSNRYRVLVS